jgi:hypothetical protein
MPSNADCQFANFTKWNLKVISIMIHTKYNIWRRFHSFRQTMIACTRCMIRPLRKRLLSIYHIYNPPYKKTRYMSVSSRVWKMLRSLHIKDKRRNATVDNERQFVRNAKKCFRHYVSLPLLLIAIKQPTMCLSKDHHLFSSWR